MALAVDCELAGKRLRCLRAKHAAACAKPDLTTGCCCDSPGAGDSRCPTNSHSNSPILRHTSAGNANGDRTLESSGDRYADGSGVTDVAADSPTTDSDATTTASAANSDTNTDSQATATADANPTATTAANTNTKAAACRAAEHV